ncbi:MAG: HepT-like ribonuclease domain-containing protein [Tunicatimonas sp.]|uniref:HepT-like ribonuclease domain-containing protein n=1 Tax=Tunicatimonas sp. TaxID=1940096 RepID=UPI003C760F54
MRRILDAEDSFPIENAKQIISTRNRIIYDYDNISDEIIWAIVTRELLKLEKEIEELIEK